MELISNRANNQILRRTNAHRNDIIIHLNTRKHGGLKLFGYLLNFMIMRSCCKTEEIIDLILAN